MADYKTTRSEVFDLAYGDVPLPTPPEGKGWELVSSAVFDKPLPSALLSGYGMMFWTWRREDNASDREGCPQCGALARTTDKLTGKFKCVGCGGFYGGPAHDKHTT